jgi:hypothetical protein
MRRMDDAPRDDASGDGPLGDDAPRDRPPGNGIGARRLAVTCMTIGLLAASTGGVLAAVGVRSSGSAAVAQYGVPPTQPPVTIAPPVAPPPAVTTPVTPPAPITVTPIAEETSKQNVKIHINVPHDTKFRKVTVEVDGKVISVMKGKKASANFSLGSLPCGKGTTTVVVIAVTSSGKTVRQSHKYHLC